MAFNNENAIPEEKPEEPMPTVSNPTAKYGLLHSTQANANIEQNGIKKPENIFYKENKQTFKIQLNLSSSINKKKYIYIFLTYDESIQL